MAINHRFTSVKPDDRDTSLINPSNWNAAHKIDTPVAIFGADGILVGSDNAGELALDGLKASSGNQFLRRKVDNTGFEFIKLSTAAGIVTSDEAGNLVGTKPAQGIVTTDGSGAVSSIKPNAGIAVSDGNGVFNSVTSAQPLRLFRSNAANNGYEFIDSSSIIKQSPLSFSIDYIFSPQTPGNALTAGITNVITLTPVPVGVNGSDINHYLYISGGVGTSEAVLITGGTAISGAVSGTITFIPANSHSGAWTIQSASAGIYEAIIATNYSLEIRIPKGSYTMYAGLVLDPAKPLILTGEGASNTGSFLNFGSVTTMPAISVTNSSITSNEPKKFRSFMIQGTGTTTGNDGIYLSNVVRVTIDNITIASFALNGIHTSNAFEITVTNGCAINYCGQWGINFSGLSNLNRIERTYVGSNSRSNGCGGIFVSGTSGVSPTEQITLDGVDVEGNGGMPFTTVTTAYGILIQYVTGIAIINSYVEGNVSDAIIYQGATKCVTEFNNWINSGKVTYAADTVGVRSWGCTFYGANAYRNISCSISSVAFGPDNALSGSPEVTNHPISLGMSGSTGAGNAAFGAGNCPATTVTAVFTWLKLIGPDGSTVYIPAWK